MSAWNQTCGTVCAQGLYSKPSNVVLDRREVQLKIRWNIRIITTKKEYGATYRTKLNGAKT
jgi:hypothetical protein